MRIRKAEAADEAAIQACVAAAYALYVERIGKPPAPMLDDYGELIERGVVSVATIDTNVVGLIVMWAKDDHFYIDNIAADPTVQGRGIGAALLNHADEAARASGHHEIRLYTNETMTENLDYYPKRGFIETHRAVEAGYNRIYFARMVPGATD